MIGVRGSLQEIKDVEDTGLIYMKESMNEADRFVKDGAKR